MQFTYLLYRCSGVVSAEDYDDSSSHISLENMSDRRAVLPDYAQGQGRRHGQGQGQGQDRRQSQGHMKTVKERFIRPSRYVPNYRQQMRFDYDVLAP